MYFTVKNIAFVCFMYSFIVIDRYNRVCISMIMAIKRTSNLSNMKPHMMIIISFYRNIIRRALFLLFPHFATFHCF